MVGEYEELFEEVLSKNYWFTIIYHPSFTKFSQVFLTVIKYPGNIFWLFCGQERFADSIKWCYQRRHMKPPYEITQKILLLYGQITEALGLCKSLLLIKPEARLSRENHCKRQQKNLAPEIGIIKNERKPPSSYWTAGLTEKNTFIFIKWFPPPQQAAT